MAARIALCPQCRTRLGVPDVKTATIRLCCPHCKQQFQVPGRTSAHKSAPLAAPYQPPRGQIGRIGLIVAAALVLLLVGGAVGYLALAPNTTPTMSEQPSPAQPQYDVVAVAEQKPAATVPAAAPSPAEAPPAPAETPVAAAEPPPAGKPAPLELPIPPAAAAVPERLREMPKQEAPAQKVQEMRPIITLPLAEQQKVRVAIARGVKFLKDSQRGPGRWGNGGHAIGYSALAGLTLLECGVPVSDPVIQDVTRFVRFDTASLTATYEISLAILFLDRLGDSQDRGLIQTLALRLVAGQNSQGGWTYQCPVLSPQQHTLLLTQLRQNQPKPLPNPLRPEGFDKLIPITHADRLPEPLEKKGNDLPNLLEKKGNDLPNLLEKKDSGLPDPLVKKSAGLPNPLQQLLGTLPTPLEKSSASDPSFLLKKEEAVRRDGLAKSAGPANAYSMAPLPLDGSQPEDRPAPEEDQAEPAEPKEPRAKAAPAGQLKDAPPQAGAPKQHPGQGQRGRRTAARRNAPGVRPGRGLGRLPLGPGRGLALHGHRDDNSNSQFAMLALWAARRHDVPMALSLILLDPRYRGSQFPDGSWSYHLQDPRSIKPSMTCVGLLGLGIGHGAAREVAAGKVLTADTVLAADKFQAPSLRDPAIQRGLWALGRAIGNPTPQRSGLPMVNLYALWSVERVAMLYQLKTIGNKDWYGWGAEILVTNQLPDGSWDSESYPGSSPTIDTCMALLFLKGNNLVQDLTDNLRAYIATADPGARE